MINLTQDKIDEILAERKAMQAQKAAEQKAVAEQKAAAQAQWAAKRAAAYKTVKIRKVHVCAKCKQILLPGTQAVSKSEFGNIATGWGVTMGFQTVYFCENCKPSEVV
jgi:RNase P subunit RPR2